MVEVVSISKSEVGESGWEGGDGLVEVYSKREVSD